MKRRIVLALLSMLLLVSVLLSSCTDESSSNDTGTGDGEVTTEASFEAVGYSVTVADYFGKGMKDVVVKAMKDGEPVSMKATGEDGKVTFKLEDGEYGVELDFPSEAARTAYEFDADALKLTPDAPALTVTLYNVFKATENVQGYSYERDTFVPFEAHKIEEGAYRLENLTLSDRTYFIFRPTRMGIYRVYVVSDARFEFGYYGGALNGSKVSLLPVENKTVELEIRNAYIGETEETTTPYVFGVMPKSESVTNCTLVVERVGDPPFSPLDVEWKTVLPTENDLKRINYLNWTFSEFTSVDITADTVTVIYNENDGLYHYGTADGPVVYLRINSASGYLGEDGTIYGAAEMSQFGSYFYDENGNFTHKESYNQLIFDYAAICDPVNGACPLTQQLVYVMETMGAWKGWFDTKSGNYLFSGTAVNADMMPYFACGYYKTVTPDTRGSDANPIRLGGDTNGAILLQKGTPLHLVASEKNLIFEIYDPNGEIKVVCNGKTYVAVNGKITLSVSDANTAFTVEMMSNGQSEQLPIVIVEIT